MQDRNVTCLSSRVTQPSHVSQAWLFHATLSNQCMQVDCCVRPDVLKYARRHVFLRLCARSRRPFSCVEEDLPSWQSCILFSQSLLYAKWLHAVSIVLSLRESRDRSAKFISLSTLDLQLLDPLFFFVVFSFPSFRWVGFAEESCCTSSHNVEVSTSRSSARGE